MIETNWTISQTFGVGLMIFVGLMSIIILLSLVPPLEFRSAKEYFKYILGAAFAIIGAEVFVLVLFFILAAIANFFFAK